MVEASSQLMSLRYSALACTRARFSCTHSASMIRPPGPLVFWAHSRTSRSAVMIGADETSATRSWLS
ncbi:Uncharacterised protein [Mycobacteroides abscessus subsp. abscessus]|nr:Uncharacterised protein [Mycobacteroides abscessus subsp. abscessus]